MTEIRGQSSEVSTHVAVMARFSTVNYLCALCVSTLKPISDLRLLISGLCALLFVPCVPVWAQQPMKVPRIGFLAGNREGASVRGFQRGLRDLGYIEGKNILVEYRYIEGKEHRVQTHLAELVQLKVNVLVSPLPQAIIAAKEATKTIPIVMMITSDPVATGIIDSLARPGGNVTGTTTLTRELSGKRLELVKEVISSITRVGILWNTSNTPGLMTGFKAYETAARALKIPLLSLEVHGPTPDLEGAFQAATKGQVSALITVRTGLLSGYQKRIADFAIRNRLPSMYEGSQDV
jgi:putative ABC transport system substrate-binding protein